jgi:Glycosyl hydrolases family 18
MKTRLGWILTVALLVPADLAGCGERSVSSNAVAQAPRIIPQAGAHGVPDGSTRQFVGYWDGWQKNNLTSTPKGVTTIPIAFAYLHGHSIVMTGIDRGYVTASDIAALHARNIKVTLSIGGASPRSAFAFDGNVVGYQQSLATLLSSLDFDGVDLDDESGTESSRINDLTTLIPASRAEFNNLGMSDAIVTYPAWNLPGENGDSTILGDSNVASALSWVNVMSYQHNNVSQTEKDLEAYAAIFDKSKLMLGVDIDDKPIPTNASLSTLSSWVNANGYGGMMAWTVNSITSGQLDAITGQ